MPKDASQTLNRNSVLWYTTRFQEYQEGAVALRRSHVTMRHGSLKKNISTTDNVLLGR